MMHEVNIIYSGNDTQKDDTYYMFFSECVSLLRIVFLYFYLKMYVTELYIDF